MTGLAEAAAMRAIMVESQVRPNQVNDRRVIDAMRLLPREAYAPAGALAYCDADIPLGKGRFLLAPMLIGRLAQLVMMNNPKHVLVVGAGSGYGAAVLAGCGAAVTALEEDAHLVVAPPREEPALRRVAGKLLLGWPSGGPYDAILIEGSVPEIPPIFAAQLAPGGRVVAILADGLAPARLGRAVIAEPAQRGFATAPMLDCTARIIPPFQPAPEFAF